MMKTHRVEADTAVPRLHTPHEAEHLGGNPQTPGLPLLSALGSQWPRSPRDCCLRRGHTWQRHGVDSTQPAADPSPPSAGAERQELQFFSSFWSWLDHRYQDGRGLFSHDENKLLVSDASQGLWILQARPLCGAFGWGTWGAQLLIQTWVYWHHGSTSGDCHAASKVWRQRA